MDWSTVTVDERQELANNAAFRTIPTASGEHATQGQFFGIANPFSDQASTAPNLQSQLVLQQPYRRSYSSHYPPNTSQVTGGVGTTAQTAPPYGSAPTTPSSIKSLPVLPLGTSPCAQEQNGHSHGRNQEGQKRQQSDLAPDGSTKTNKRRRSVGPETLVEASGEHDQLRPALSEDDRLLLSLKQEQNMSWKDISKELEKRLGRTYQIPALQMRYKRLKKRLRTWTDQDVTALQAAYEYWENKKFEIVAQKMLDFGVPEEWPAKSVEKKWEQLHP